MFLQFEQEQTVTNRTVLLSPFSFFFPVQTSVGSVRVLGGACDCVTFAEKVSFLTPSKRCRARASGTHKGVFWPTQRVPD